ncbi:MAG: hypothetical protein QM703_08305 [Gemmatales bacterium]
MATVKSTGKKTDLPPRGNRNPDPITGAAGAHPIETGVGAALGGAAQASQQVWWAVRLGLLWAPL